MDKTAIIALLEWIAADVKDQEALLATTSRLYDEQCQRNLLLQAQVDTSRAAYDDCVRENIVLQAEVDTLKAELSHVTTARDGRIQVTPPYEPADEPADDRATVLPDLFQIERALKTVTGSYQLDCKRTDEALARIGRAYQLKCKRTDEALGRIGRDLLAHRAGMQLREARVTRGVTSDDDK